MSFEEAWSLVKGMNTVRCNKCMWEGEEEDLVMYEDEDGFGKGCPKCETDAYLMDLEESVEMFGLPSGHYAKVMKVAVEAVRAMVEQGNSVMPSVKLVADQLDIKGRDLMREYTEAYR